jgi:hypothetical protein
MEDYHLDFRNDPFVDLKIRQLCDALSKEISQAVRRHGRRSHLRSELRTLHRLLRDIADGKTFALPEVCVRAYSYLAPVKWEMVPFSWGEL